MDYLGELKKALIYNGIIGEAEDLTKDNYMDFVKEFQSKRSLPITGLTDDKTLWALQYDLVKDSPRKKLATVDVDGNSKCGDMANFTFREDLKESFVNAMQEIHSYGGGVYSSGAMRYLNAPVTTGRSATSLHYTGIALDLCINAGFYDPDTDPYVVVRERFDSDVEDWTSDDFYFKIYFRSPEGTPSVLKGIYWEDHTSTAGPDLFKEVEGNFICLSDVMHKHGFGTIAPHPDFLSGPTRNYISSEWWHFNASWLLVRGFSVFGIELLKIYDEETLKKSPPWEYKEAIFKSSGFVTDPYVDPLLSL